MATRGQLLLFKGRAPRCLVQSSLILNVLTRKSSLLRPEDKQKNINAAT